MKIHISPEVEEQSPRDWGGDEDTGNVTWLRKLRPWCGAQTNTHHCVKMDVIFRAFNWPCEQILLATESGSGNVGYPPTFAVLQVIQIWRCGQSCGSAGPGKPPTYAPTPPPCCSPFPHHHRLFWSLLDHSQQGTKVELPLQPQGGVQAEPSHVLWSVQALDETWQKQNQGPIWVISGGLSIGLGPHPRNRTELGLRQSFWGESQEPEVRDKVDPKPEGPSLESEEDRTKPCGWSQVVIKRGHITQETSEWRVLTNPNLLLTLLKVFPLVAAWSHWKCRRQARPRQAVVCVCGLEPSPPGPQKQAEQHSRAPQSLSHTL